MDRIWLPGVKRTPTPSRRVLQINLPVTLRLAERADLPKLEWGGEYRHFRRLFQQTFREQHQKKRLMVLAIFNDYPIGQLFIQLEQFELAKHDGLRGYFYSLRVMTPFQRQGIGSALLREGERLLIERRYESVSIAAAKTNLNAKRLYERLGYQVFGEESGAWSYEDHEGRTQHVIEPCWVLEKRL
jgi:ribosomal protein S18 acetylase RimI-like enzyme